MLRVFEPEDRQAVEALLAGVPEAAGWTPESEAGAAAAAQAWVWEEQGSIVGVAAARAAADEAEILNLAVAPGWRGRGVGGALLGAALAAVRARGARRAYLEVRESNQAARRFYGRFGFAETGKRRNYYQAPAEDAVLLAASLE